LKWPALESVFSARPDLKQCDDTPPLPPTNAGKTTM
jgi:hypothetical protein